ncbi:MAG TPA: hypothetical protein VLC71_05970 [Thermomonas sp.]|nr:hypothetical protein [Thermomonas sp.]
MDLIVNLLCALIILTQMSLELWRSRPRGWSPPAVMRLSVRLLLAGGALGVLIDPLYGRTQTEFAEVVINLGVAIVCIARFIRLSHLLAGLCPADWLPGGLSCNEQDTPR